MATEDFDALLKANSESYMKQRSLVDRAQQDLSEATNDIERNLLYDFIEKQTALVESIKREENNILNRKAKEEALDKFPYLNLGKM